MTLLHDSAELSPEPLPERVLFVHAHPDDETIATGGSLAELGERGVEAVLLTCTRGERGEVIPPILHHLEGDGPALAAHREGELAAALAVLGVSEHLYLGDLGARAAGMPRRVYRDSGMLWGADGRPEPLPDLDGESFCSAPLAESTADILAAINELAPDAVVSYDAGGGYGHPDHIRAHLAARAAAEAAGLPFFAIVSGEPEPGDLVLDVAAQRPRVAEAMRAHATQITVRDDDSHFALSSGPDHEIAAVEAFRPLPARGIVPSVAPVAEPAAGLSRTATIVSGVIAAAVGAFVGALLTVNHQQVVEWAGVSIPLGLIGALAVVGALVAGLRLLSGGRAVAACAALGVVVVCFMMAQRGPGGSVLVPGNLLGYLWSYGSLVVAALVLAWPQLPQRPAR